MDKDIPCFFWIDNSLNEEDQIVVAICEECQKTQKKENAWFWKDGYGNFDVNCHICNCFIKKINPERK
jgi:hypothetical protein